MFLLLDLKKYGEFSLEEDIPVDLSSTNPTALGLTYELIEPMKKWRIRYSGPLLKGCRHPKLENRSNMEKTMVEIDLTYEVDTSMFWYMRDDHPLCLARNLSQEPWGLNFLKTCLRRTNDHGHYEEFGRLKGTIKVDKNAPEFYDFGTFRDHSWDIRRWATMDNLLILLIALEKPLILNDGKEYWYLDLTLVDMPGNQGGN